MSETMMALNKVLSMVRGLVVKAEHPDTPAAEAKACREKADALMLKYAVDEALARATMPAAEKPLPVVIEVSTGDFSDIIGYITGMLREVALYSRCLVRNYTSYRNGEWYSKVYGFEHDIRYFEVLYTTLRLHMLGALLPKVETEKSLEDNCYRLHNAGYNWLDIGTLYGWEKMPQDRYPDIKIPYRHRETGQVAPSTTVGGLYKRPYYKACKARGEKPTIIQAGGTRTYRKSAAKGYLNRIYQRLMEAKRARATGSDIVLAGSVTDLDAYFREHNPDLFEEVEVQDEPKRRGRKRVFRPDPLNEEAYRRGVAHANTADISPGSHVGGYKHEIEES